MAHARTSRRLGFRFDFPLLLTIALIVLLWTAGGASRAEALGQVVVRTGSWAVLVAAVLVGPRPEFVTIRPVLFFLVAAIALPLVQLVPLPPSWWQALPGREVLLLPGETPPWRTWTMTPGATRNALASLVVPGAMLIVLAQADEKARDCLPMILVVAIISAVVLGLLQFSGARFNSPFLNDTPGQVSAIFANRNHFALLIAIGCLIVPVWAVRHGKTLAWRGPLAVSLLLMFVLTILATGSRSGMLLGGLALAFGFALVGRRLHRRFGQAPAWVFPALITASVLVIGSFVILSIAADRAAAINRLIALDANSDMRSRALPTVLSMIAIYMPFGSGFGGFDPIFRIHEPLALLKPTYFNQAHNDFLGIALDGGGAGIAVLVAAILWWLVATIRVWRAKPDDAVMLARLGSAMIFLILVASVIDYPARTPMIMGIIVIAASWLSRAKDRKPDTSLPARKLDL